MWPETEVTKKENKRELKLSGAAISEKIESSGLDMCIFQLTSLNLLNISDTSLQVLPDEISNLTNLQTILLFGNALTQLPATIGVLDKLKVLDVSRNKLTTVPKDISALTNLAAINLSTNCLTDFPALSLCTKLNVLDLSHNKLQSFPDVCVDSLSALSDINLKGNEIESIPGDIVHLVSLKHFSLAENKIKTVPKILAAISKLKGIYSLVSI